jgi:hypothetical protein
MVLPADVQLSPDKKRRDASFDKKASGPPWIGKNEKCLPLVPAHFGPASLPLDSLCKIA